MSGKLIGKEHRRMKYFKAKEAAGSFTNDNGTWHAVDEPLVRIPDKPLLLKPLAEPSFGDKTAPFPDFDGPNVMGGYDGVFTRRLKRGGAIGRII